MPSIHAAKKRMAKLALSRNGISVFIKGIEHTAVFFDGEIATDHGYEKQTSLSFDPEIMPQFERGDSIFINGELFEVKRIADDDQEILTLVELHRA